MKFCSLFSGSSGNSLFIQNKDTRILCDAGKNGKQIELALNEIDERAADLDAIILTHEHSDHVAAAGVLSRRFDIPLYANGETWERLHAQNIGKIKPHNERIFDTHEPFIINSLEINSFETSHDAAHSVGFLINDGKKKMGIATDTGIITQDMNEYLTGCSLVVLESNHDIHMLEAGSYPYRLKQRIKSPWGHLSNERAADYAKDLVLGGVDKIILAHLSGENNIPFLAEQEAVNTFAKHSIKAGLDVLLEVARRDRISNIFKI